jgi:hypothetical protein
MTNETTIQHKIMLAASRVPGVRLFRNNTGFDKTAKVRYGLCVGSSDLIGWKTITIKPHHVGQKIAVFVALEVKTPTGRPTTEQLNFIDVVDSSGGHAGIVRSEEDAVTLLG